MEKQRRVVLYGKSVILGTLGASLGAYSELETVRLSPPLPAPRELAALRAHVIIFDLNTVPPDFSFRLLHDQPHLLLIGVDAAGDKLLVLSGQQAHAVTTVDLLRVIKEWPGSSRQPFRRQVQVDRLWQMIAGWTAHLRTRARAQKLAFAVAAITVCVVLAVVLSGPTVRAPLAGTAVGAPVPDVGLAFAGGIVLGGAGIALWFRWRRQKNGKGR